MLTPDLLEQRLIDFGAAVCRETRRLPRDIAGTHLAKQLVHSGTAPAASYAEARAAESRRDFVHKLQIALKELRETNVWLKMTDAVTARSSGVPSLERECDELVRILGASVNTAAGRQRRQRFDRDAEEGKDHEQEENG